MFDVAVLWYQYDREDYQALVRVPHVANACCVLCNSQPAVAFQYYRMELLLMKLMIISGCRCIVKTWTAGVFLLL